MSIKLMSKVWLLRDVAGTEKLILLAIADACNDQGVCWPGQQTLAQKATIGIRQVNYHLEKLEKSGYITRQQRAGTSSLYRINIAALEAAQDVDPDPAAEEIYEQPPRPAKPARPARPAPQPEPPAADDDFTNMQAMIERLLGVPVPPTPKDVTAIGELIKIGATEQDITAALAFFQDKGLVCHGPAALLKSVRYAISARTQAGVAAGHSKKGALVGPPPGGYSAAQWQKAERERLRKMMQDIAAN